MNKKIPFLMLLLGILLIGGCTKDIKDIKSDEYLDKEVTVRGTVQSTIKLGSISGYNLVDKNGDEIIVTSDSLPSEGSTKKVSGTVKKFPLITAYYIESDE